MLTFSNIQQTPKTHLRIVHLLAAEPSRPLSKCTAAKTQMRIPHALNSPIQRGGEDPLRFFPFNQGGWVADLGSTGHDSQKEAAKWLALCPRDLIL